MQSAIYQLALIIGLGTLAVLLIRGFPLLTALFRSGIVLMGVLIILVIAGGILRLGVQPKEADEDTQANELGNPLPENENQPDETEGT
jgi:multisubunit Na+/H+ antiporter MnhC subunit